MLRCLRQIHTWRKLKQKCWEIAYCWNECFYEIYSFLPYFFLGVNLFIGFCPLGFDVPTTSYETKALPFETAFVTYPNRVVESRSMRGGYQWPALDSMTDGAFGPNTTDMLAPYAAAMAMSALVSASEVLRHCASGSVDKPLNSSYRTGPRCPLFPARESPTE